MALIKLTYVSRAAFASYSAANGVEPTVARILLASRRNNPAIGVVGGLYYGDGCFFQYLEGEESAVHALFVTIQNDSRHRDVRVIQEQPIEALSFSDWSMKYVPVAGEVESFLRRQGLDGFDPYQFSAPMVDEMVRLIHASDEKVSRSSGRGLGQTLALALATSLGLVIAGIAYALLRPGG